MRKEGKQKAKEKRKDILICIQSSKEEQGEIRKPSYVSNAKKIEENNRMGKTKISSRKLEIPRELFI